MNIRVIELKDNPFFMPFFSGYAETEAKTVSPQRQAQQDIHTIFPEGQGRFEMPTGNLPVFQEPDKQKKR